MDAATDTPKQPEPSQETSTQDSNRQFELFIYIPKAPFLESSDNIQTDSGNDSTENHYNVLVLPVTKLDALHEFKQTIYDSIDGYWHGAIAFHRVFVTPPSETAEGEEHQQQQLNSIPQILTDKPSELVGEHCDLSTVFPESLYPDYSVRRAVKIVAAPFSESESRAHVLRVRDVCINASPAFQASKYYKNPPYDPASIAIDAGLSLAADIRAQCNHPVLSSDDAQNSDENVTTSTKNFKSSSKNRRSKSGRSKAKQPPHQNKNQQQQQVSSKSNSVNESENTEHAFIGYNSENSTDPFASISLARQTRKIPKAPALLKALTLSPWNPVPHHLRLRGQLLYISAVTLEGEYLHITSTPNGYYVDRSDNHHFDTTPRQTKQRFSNPVFPELFSLLSSHSPIFVANLTELNSPSPVFEPLMTVPVTNCIPAYPWLVQQPTLQADSLRSQSAFLLTGSTTAESLPQARDWNEELVQIRELPKRTGEERLFRDRVLARYYSDFVNSAARSVPAIVRGDIPPLNPNDAKEMATYITNNTLFTPAEDALDVYTHLGGHEAARVVAKQDLAGIQRLNTFDIDKLNLMATAVVDFQGERWLAQSLVPGIFNRQPEEQQTDKEGEDVNGKEDLETKPQSTPSSFKIVYGNLDTEKPDEAHIADPEFHKLAEKIADCVNLSLHTVTDVNGKETQLYTSADSHGVMASDGRSYLIDVFRLQPVDVEFVENDVESKPFGLPETDTLSESTEYPHRMTFLRAELLNLFREQERRKWSNKILEERASKKVESGEETTKQLPAGEMSKEGDVKKEAEEGKEDVKKDDTPEVINLDEFTLSFNVDAFVDRKGGEKMTPEEKEARNADPGSKAVRDASLFLRDVAIPSILRDVATVGNIPGDGGALSRHLHSTGINVRYLGRLANEIDNGSMLENFTEAYRPDAKRNLENFKTILIRNMIARSAKHLLRKAVRGVCQANVSYAVAHFLNCLLDEEYIAEQRPQTLVQSDEEWTKLTPNSLRKDLSQEVARRFRYYLNPEEQLLPAKLDQVQVLRELCLSVGLQLALKNYEFGKKTSTVTNGTSSPTTNGHNSDGNGAPVKGSSSSSKKKLTNHHPTSHSSATFDFNNILNMYPIAKGTPYKSLLAEEMMEQGSICYVRGHLELGESLTADAISFYEQVYGNVHPEVAHQFHALGIVYHQLAQPLSRRISLYEASQTDTEQQQQSEEALQKMKAESGIQNDDMYEVAKKELQFYLESAVKMIRQSVIIAERTLGLDHPDTIQQYTDLGIVEHAVGHVELGLLLTKYALELWEVTFGKNHPETSRRLSNAAQMIQAWQGQEKSIPMLIEAYKAAIKTRGEDSVASGNALFNLAQAQCCAGDFTNGGESAKKASEIFKARLGSEDEKTKGTENMVTFIEQASADLAKDAEARASRVARRLGWDTTRAHALLTKSSTTAGAGSKQVDQLLKDDDEDLKTGSKGHLDVAELLSYIEGPGAGVAATSSKKKNSIRRKK